MNFNQIDISIVTFHSVNIDSVFFKSQDSKDLEESFCKYYLLSPSRQALQQMISEGGNHSIGTWRKKNHHEYQHEPPSRADSRNVLKT